MGKKVKGQDVVRPMCKMPLAQAQLFVIECLVTLIDFEKDHTSV